MNKLSQLIPTYSIVARDPKNGQLGVGVQSHYFGVGKVVPWAEYGVGAVATQSFSEYSYGPLGLDLMRSGKDADNALKSLLAKDEHRQLRQVAFIDVNGNVAVHTGEKCIQVAGHRIGDNFSVQANLMLKNTVWDAMAEKFVQESGDLAYRILASLEAAEAEGGDIRGKQSVAILVVAEDHAGDKKSAPLYRLHVEDSKTPLEEMRRLLNYATAYKYQAAAGEILEGKNLTAQKESLANKEYLKSIALMPPTENPELVFWHAISLVEANLVDKALPLFQQVFAINPNWRTLIPRLVDSEILSNDQDIIDKIINLTESN